MKNRHLFPALFCLALAGPASAEIPAQLSYQGRVAVQGVNFNGTGQFKFALVLPSNLSQTATASGIATVSLTSVNVGSGGSGYTTPPLVTIAPPDDPGGVQATATATIDGGVVTGITITEAGSGYFNNPVQVTIAPPPPNIQYFTSWSNDQTSISGGEPASAISIPVTNGLYSVNLGDTAAGMAALMPGIFASAVELRVWFSDGVNGFQQLTPDQPLSTAPYAFRAIMAETVPPNSITSAQIAEGGVTTASLASGAVTTATIAPGAVTGPVLAPGAVGAANLASNAVTSTNLADGSVGSAKLADNAVGGAKIADGGIGAGKLAPGAAAANLNAGGNQAVTLGSASFTGPLVVGLSNSVTGAFSAAFGQSVQATGTNSIAAGEATLATGKNSAAFGKSVAALGTNALAANFSTLARGANSAAFGASTIAAGANSFACGKFNNDDPNHLFSVGNGTANLIRETAFSVDVAGNVEVQGNIDYGGSLINSSDVRLKDLGAPFTPGLQAISGIAPLHYRYKKDNPKNLPSDIEKIGVVAQALRSVLPEAVVEDSDGYLSVKQEPVFWAMVNAIKELKAENDDLRARLEAIEAKVE